MNIYVPDGLLPILTCFPTYDTSIKFSKLFYENYENIPQHKVLFDEYVIYTDVGYQLGSVEFRNDNGTQFWYKNKVFHRGNDKPAYIGIGGKYKAWYINGKRHREGDNPAIIWPNTTQEWWINGEHHRENDKPARIWNDGSQEWYLNGELCRE